MDQATLVGPDIYAGDQVVQVLDNADLNPVVALLAHLDNYEDWRLVLSSPALDQKHTLRAYDKVAETLAGRFVARLPPMLILPTKDPFIKELRRLFAKTKDVTGMRLGGHTVGNKFISDAYVYRII